MALKKCKECGNQVSTKADACPNCGARLKGKSGGCFVELSKLIGGLVGAIIGLVIAISLLSNGSEDRDPIQYLQNKCRELSESIPDVSERPSAYSSCLETGKAVLKSKGVIDARNGNKLAQELFSKAKDMTPEEFEDQANKSADGKSKTVPKFSDYGTDMASVSKYMADLNETSIDACRAGWAQKDADATYCLALQETGEKNIAMLREASKLGHPIAQNNLATELDNGNRPEDSAEINKLIKASAESGVPHAQVTAGWWHMTGEHGFQVNHAEAMKWNLKAYKQGHSEGANNIGELYEKGHGVPKDIEIAKSWYKKSAVFGNAEAAERLERLSPRN